jgi:hypothetical protein
MLYKKLSGDAAVNAAYLHLFLKRASKSTGKRFSAGCIQGNRNVGFRLRELPNFLAKSLFAHKRR